MVSLVPMVDPPDVWKGDEIIVVALFRFRHEHRLDLRHSTTPQIIPPTADTIAIHIMSLRAAEDELAPDGPLPDC